MILLARIQRYFNQNIQEPFYSHLIARYYIKRIRVLVLVKGLIFFKKVSLLYRKENLLSVKPQPSKSDSGLKLRNLDLEKCITGCKAQKHLVHLGPVPSYYVSLALWLSIQGTLKELLFLVALIQQVWNHTENVQTRIKQITHPQNYSSNIYGFQFS